MRNRISSLLGAVLACGLLAFATSAQEKPATTQELLEAARKAQQRKGSKPPAKRVFTNDTIPSAAGASESSEAAQASGGGSGAASGSGSASGSAAAGAAAAGGAPQNESQWRQKFAELRAKIATAEKEADLIQRERNLNEQQYYTNPNKALREQYTRDELNNQKAKIDAKKEEIARLKQELADLEDALRKAGGPPAWAREQ